MVAQQLEIDVTIVIHMCGFAARGAERLSLSGIPNKFLSEAAPRFAGKDAREPHARMRALLTHR